jgi:hypothetical protein
MMTRYAGSEWIKSNFKVEMSPFGEAVASLLGDVFLGIYHLKDKDLKKVEWENTSYIKFILHHYDLSTYNPDHLTRLVVLCHDRAIKLSISARSPGRLELFFRRRGREGDWTQIHPTMEDAIHKIRVAYD